MFEDNHHSDVDCLSIPDHPGLKNCAGELRALYRPSIRLLATPVEDDLPVGVSKFGGHPDLPDGVDWPTTQILCPRPSEGFLKAHPNERRLPEDGIIHLSFVGQINLKEIQPFDRESQLPKSGLLSFFYNPQVFASDTDPGSSSGIQDHMTGYRYDLFGWDHLANWQVLFTDSDPSVLRRREFPNTLYEAIQYNPNCLTFRVENCLPSLETSYFPRPESDDGHIKLTQEEWETYRALRYDLRANLGIHQMLGCADQWAATTDEESYWRWRDHLFPELPPEEALSTAERNTEAASIRLLLQVNTFDDTAEWWGRGGTLYFFIRECDLRACNFSKVWGEVE